MVYSAKQHSHAINYSMGRGNGPPRIHRHCRFQKMAPMLFASLSQEGRLLLAEAAAC